MEEPSCGAQFRAAVQVIQGLPRSGAYRPSYEEMLRFYSYYKQATAGCCQGPRPGFWDPIGRYKWDAWHSLGRMSKEEAMAAYVAEMKKVAQKVIDTVPMDETTQEMFRYFEPLYEVIHDMPRPPEFFFKRKGGEQSGTAGRPHQDVPGSSPAPECPEDALPGEQQAGSTNPGRWLAPATEGLEGSQVTSDSEGDMYCDTLEQGEPKKAGGPQGLTPNGIQAGAEPLEPRGAGQGLWGEGRRPEGSSSTDLEPWAPREIPSPPRGSGIPGTTAELSPELEAHVASAVQPCRRSLRRVRERLSRLETLTWAQGDTAGTDPDPALTPQVTSPWPLTVSPGTLLFLATWPFLTQWLLRRWQGRNR
ncbi:LOW QUALITY PROTEIN: acyl-CoA-binding domain-containing protein 4 [Chiroxiphia lanceolata]|uniref:LOW QUALITY PROTEIN: acyl-CoA-binding domain-containing protein 4 n=1 Tax=Chiroxiphia lanceolata TaxID=296741 RepID=UPI0013CEB1C2|nr:LOW QUALITY PROTEIN: acyl-CoA-binding domain-containing protein 4 [Chiroxiphia lanceolata]